MDSYDGKVCYCIELVFREMLVIPIPVSGENFWDNYPKPV
jgi:hypothetical protein